MNRLTHLILLSALVSGFASAAESRSPNILFIFSDDHALKAISAYGGPLAKPASTPHIDRLAKEGIRFNHCLVTNSICAPSRAVVLTGKHSHLNGQLTNHEQLNGSQQTAPKPLQKAGYTTAIVGKWHLKSTPTGLDHFEVLKGQGSDLGEHGWSDKHRMYEESLHAPLLARWPRVIKPGRSNDSLVSNLDFAETFLEAAGADIPEDMQGRSLVPLLRGKAPEDWRKTHYYHYHEGGGHGVHVHFGVTDGRYKLIRFPDENLDAWEFFDLKKNPLEL